MPEYGQGLHDLLVLAQVKRVSIRDHRDERYTRSEKHYLRHSVQGRHAPCVPGTVLCRRVSGNICALIALSPASSGAAVTGPLTPQVLGSHGISTNFDFIHRQSVKIKHHTPFPSFRQPQNIMLGKYHKILPVSGCYFTTTVPLLFVSSCLFLCLRTNGFPDAQAVCCAARIVFIFRCSCFVSLSGTLRPRGPGDFPNLRLGDKCPLGTHPDRRELLAGHRFAKRAVFIFCEDIQTPSVPSPLACNSE